MSDYDLQVKVTTPADVAGLEQAAQATKASATEAERYNAQLERMAAAQAGGMENLRAGMERDQAGWEAKRQALLERKAGSQASVSSAQQSADAQSLAQAWEYEAKALGQAGAAAEKAAVSKSTLAKGITMATKAVPELGVALRGLLNPFMLVALGVGYALSKVIGYIQKVNEEARKAEGFDDFRAAMQSARVGADELKRANAELATSMAKIADTTKSAADRQKEFADNLALVARLEAEKDDVDKAVELARVEADPILNNAQKAQAKAAINARYRAKREKADQERETREYDNLFRGAINSGKDAETAFRQFEALGPSLQLAKTAENEAGKIESDAKLEYDLKFAELLPQIKRLKEYLAGGKSPGLPGVTSPITAAQKLAELESDLKGAKGYWANAQIETGRTTDARKTIEANRSELAERAKRATEAQRVSLEEARKMEERSPDIREHRAYLDQRAGEQDAAEAAKAKSEFEKQEQRRRDREEQERQREAEREVREYEQNRRRGVPENLNPMPDTAGIQQAGAQTAEAVALMGEAMLEALGRVRETAVAAAAAAKHARTQGLS